MRPGELYLADLGPTHTRGFEQAGWRPVLVVHSEGFQRIPNLALICPLTRTDRGVPNHVPIEPDDYNGLRSSCFVMTEQIRAIDRRFVKTPLGLAPPAVTRHVLSILRDRLLAEA